MLGVHGLRPLHYVPILSLFGGSRHDVASARLVERSEGRRAMQIASNDGIPVMLPPSTSPILSLCGGSPYVCLARRDRRINEASKKAADF
jgi:hypothetical protein